VKSKFGLSQNHKTDVLQDKNYGINLMQLQDKLDQQSLNNISTHIRSESTTGTIVRAAIKVASRKAIKNILQCPISSTKITTNTNNLIADISRKLVKYDINLRNPKEKTEGNIALNMAPKEYNRYWEDLMRNGITKYTDIQSHNRQTTKSFNTWVQTITQPTRKAKLIEQILVPEWYQAILRTIDPTITNIDLNTTVIIPTITTIIHPQIIPETVINTIGTILDVWTDGTKKDDDMGSAIIFTEIDKDLLEKGKPHDQNEDNITKETSFTIPKSVGSSTKSELYAIYGTVLQLESGAITRINTDSQASIDGINKMLRNTMTEREILKTPNSGLLLAIANEMKRTTTQPELLKVKAHIGLPLNERADRNAKAITEDKQQIPFEYLQDRLPNHPRNEACLHKNNEKIEIYPGQYIANITKEKLAIQNKLRLENKWQTEVDGIKSAKFTHYGMGKLTRFDASHTKEHKFRINLSTKCLYTAELAKIHKRTSDPRCRRCKTEIESQTHVMECSITTKFLEKTKEEAIHNLINRNSSKEFSKIICKDPSLPFELLGLFKSDSMKKPIAYGIISKENTADIIQHEDFNSEWIFPILDAWLSAVYQTIWKPRLEQTYIKHSKNKMKQLPDSYREPRKRTEKDSTLQPSKRIKFIIKMNKTPEFINHSKPAKRIRITFKEESIELIRKNEDGTTHTRYQQTKTLYEKEHGKIRKKKPPDKEVGVLGIFG